MPIVFTNFRTPDRSPTPHQVPPISKGLPPTSQGLHSSLGVPRETETNLCLSEGVGRERMLLDLLIAGDHNTFMHDALHLDGLRLRDRVASKLPTYVATSSLSFSNWAASWIAPSNPMPEETRKRNRRSFGTTCDSQPLQHAPPSIHGPTSKRALQ